MVDENPVRLETEPLEDGGTARHIGEPGKLFAPGLGLFTFGLNMAVLTPVLLTLPLKIQALVGSEHAAGAFGLAAALGAVVAIICSPLGGWLSDRTTSRFGMRRPWIIGGAIGGALSLQLIAVADSLWLVIMGWILAQIFTTTALSAASATVADQVPPERRGLVSGLVGFGTPLALLAGTVVINAFSSYTWRFGVPGALLIISATVFVVILRDRRLDQPPPRIGLKEFALAFVFNPRRYPDFGWLWIGRFAILFSYSGLLTFIVFLLNSRLGLEGDALTGTIVLATLGYTTAMIVSSILFGVLSDRFHRRKPFVAAGCVIIAVALVIIASPHRGDGHHRERHPRLRRRRVLRGRPGTGHRDSPRQSDTGKDLGVLAITGGLSQSIAPAIAPGIIALGTPTLSGYSLLYLLGAMVAILGAVFVYRIKGAR